MDRLDMLEAFITVAELKSFSAAAARMKRSAPTITRLVAALEERLGVRLLQRTTRSVALSDAGGRFFERARPLLAEMKEAEASAMARNIVPSGRLVVTGPAGFGRLHLAPLMSTFLTRNPEVRGELLLTDRTLSLVEEGIDVGVRIGHLADTSLMSRRVGETARLLVASPGYLASQRPPRHPKDLARHRLIHLSGLAPLAEWRFEQRGRATLIRFEPVFTTNSVDAVTLHALNGAGIGLVLAYQVADQVDSGALEVLLPGFQPPPLPIHCVWPSSRLMSAAVRAFVDDAAKRHWRFLN